MYINGADHENIGYLPDIEELNEDTVTSMRQFLNYTRVAGIVLYLPTYLPI